MSLEKIIDLDRLSRFKGKVDVQLNTKVDKPYEFKVFHDASADPAYTVSTAPGTLSEAWPLLYGKSTALTIWNMDTDEAHYSNGEAFPLVSSIVILFKRIEPVADVQTISITGATAQAVALVGVVDDNNITWQFYDLGNIPLALASDLSNKVDKESGKGLSTNDFTNSYKEKVDNCVADISKNLITYPFSRTSQTINGVTFTDNGDGTVTANGTATANSTFVVHGWTIADGSLPVNPEITYKITGSPNGASSSTYFVACRFYTSEQTPGSTTGTLKRDTGSGITFTGATYVSVYVAVIGGQTVNNLLFKPVMTYASIPGESFSQYGESVIPYLAEALSSKINTETDPTVPAWAKEANKPSYTASEVGALPSSTTYAGSPTIAGPATFANGLHYAQVDSTSTATAFTATIPGITEYYDGLTVILKNGVVTSASGFTININGLGAKHSYSNLAAATADTTLFNINYTMMFIYDSTRVSGGGWICYRGYDTNTNTIGYQLRTNSTTMPMSEIVYRYRLLFTSANGKKFVPANTSSSTDATTSRTVNQTPIDPFGMIFYYAATASVAAGSRPAAASLWTRYNITLGYSFNRTGAALALSAYNPVYVKAAPQTNGSAIIDATTPFVQSLPSTDDGNIYIFLGIASSATAIELVDEHPVYCYRNGAIQQWTGAQAEIDALKTRLDALVVLDEEEF